MWNQLRMHYSVPFPNPTKMTIIENLKAGTHRIKRRGVREQQHNFGSWKGNQQVVSELAMQRKLKYKLRKKSQVELYHTSSEMGLFRNGKHHLPLKMGFVWARHRKSVWKNLCEAVTHKFPPSFHPFQSDSRSPSLPEGERFIVRRS